MSKYDWKATIAKVAPGIATALGGPLAGVAVGMATKALGIEGGDEDALAAAVASGDPSVLVKLKEVENNFRIELKRMDVTLEELEVKDRASARDLAKSTGIQPQVVLSTIFVGAFAGLLWLLFTGQATGISTENREISYLLLGILSAGMTQVMNFWFGSSAGSKAKTEQQAAIIAGRKQ